MDADPVNRSDGKIPHPQAMVISNLKRREIQAPLVASLLQELAKAVGPDKALDIISAAIQRDAVQSGMRLAQEYGGNGIKELVQVLEEVWAGDDALEFSILEQTDRQLNFDVLGCRYAELYERLGVKELGTCMSCDRDAIFIKSFNPRMNLVRTQTIMQGALLCDFRIHLE